MRSFQSTLDFFDLRATTRNGFVVETFSSPAKNSTRSQQVMVPTPPREGVEELTPDQPMALALREKRVRHPSMCPVIQTKNLRRLPHAPGGAQRRVRRLRAGDARARERTQRARGCFGGVSGVFKMFQVGSVVLS